MRNDWKFGVRYDGDAVTTRFEGDGGSLLGGKKSKGEGEGDGLKKPLTKKGMNKAINNAIANLTKAELPKAIEAQLKPITDQLAEVLKATKGGGGDEGNKGGDEGNKGGNGGNGGNTGKLPPEVQAVLNDLQRSNKSLADELQRIKDEKVASDKKAEEAERNSAIRAELGKYNFASDSAAESAFRLINLEVARDEDGKLIAGNLPLDAFVKEALTTKHDYFLASKEVGGAGAQRTQQRRTAAPSLDDIRKDMSAEKRAEVAQAILQSYQSAQQGQ